MIQAQTIILACGVSWRRLEIDGFERLVGRGVFYGAARSEAANVRGLDIHIIGAGNSAGQAAMFFSAHARSVTILYRGDSLEKSMSHYLVEQLADPREHPRPLPNRGRRRPRRQRARGDRHPRRGDRPDDARSTRAGCSSSSAPTPRPRGFHPRSHSTRRATSLRASTHAPRGRWQLDRDPYLLETSVPGIFACGDVRYSPVKRVAAAVGEGSMAIAFVHQYLAETKTRGS